MGLDRHRHLRAVPGEPEGDSPGERVTQYTGGGGSEGGHAPTARPPAPARPAAPRPAGRPGVPAAPVIQPRTPAAPSPTAPDAREPDRAESEPDSEDHTDPQPSPSTPQAADREEPAAAKPEPVVEINTPEPSPMPFDEEPELRGVTPPTTRTHSGDVVDALVSLGFIDRETADRYAEQAMSAGRATEMILVEEGVVNSDQLSRAVAERYGLDHVDLNNFQVDMGAANLLPTAAAKRYQAIPVGFLGEGEILLAVANPANVLAVDDIQMMTGRNCRVAVAASEDIESLIGKLGSLDSAISAAIESDHEEHGDDELDALEAVGEDDAPVIKLVNSIMGQAVGEGASDIHFEPGDNDMRVRFRVDGVMHEVATIPKRMMNGVTSRLKIMCELDIAEKRVPQDGRVGITVDDKMIDLRMTTLPTQRGEGAVMRILDKTSAMRSLDELGMDPDPRKRFSDAFKQSYGCVLVTGPTGSGKSTTLYSALNEVNDVDKKIITIEDPVEYRLDGINQMHVNHKAGMTFAKGLKSMLRADPDIIMVGEIRDGETARIAIDAALTGHMVLSTLHTNDAPGAISRMLKMGIEPFLISSALDCVLAQRLARRVCSNCAKEKILPVEALRASGFQADDDITGVEGEGCARCSGTGYKGRLGLHSVMVLTENIKEMVIRGAQDNEIDKAAQAEGMLTLRQAGLEKVAQGLTTVDEIARVTV